jgi:ABC-type multidrug transport system ATPase subunit
MTPFIEVSHLSKHYKNLKAVNDLSFTVPAGEVYGFLGQNGAGKSTTIRMLLTLIQPTGGGIKLFGKDLAANRKAILSQVGAIIEKPDLYKYLTAYQNLQLLAKLSGLKPAEAMLMRQLEVVGIAGRAHSKVKTFSQGMKQRLGIACALIHNPQLVILDEPTNGLDPQGITDVRNLILHLSRNEGKTVLISSHLLSEIQLIADSMLIIDKGRKIVEGKVDSLMNPADTLVEVVTTDDAAARQQLQETAWATHLQKGQGLLLKMHKAEVPQLVQSLVASNIAVLSVHPRHSLEDYFLSLTQRTHADAAAH